MKRIIVGGHSEQNNLFIAEHICKILDEKCPRKDGVTYATQITFVEDRAGHNRRYAIDATKIETELRWKAQENFHTGIAKTIDWYLIKNLGKRQKRSIFVIDKKKNNADIFTYRLCRIYRFTRYRGFIGARGKGYWD